MRFCVQDKAAEEKHKENLIYKRQLIGLLAKVHSCQNNVHAWNSVKQFMCSYKNSCVQCRWWE